MTFLRILLGLPIVVLLLVFAFVNNDMVELSLWPTSLELVVSLSVLIVLLFLSGYILGRFFAWMSYSSVRKSLRIHKKEKVKISKEQEKLIKEVEGLRGNIDVLKSSLPTEKPVSFAKKIKNFFRSNRK